MTELEVLLALKMSLEIRRLAFDLLADLAEQAEASHDTETIEECYGKMRDTVLGEDAS